MGIDEHGLQAVKDAVDIVQIVGEVVQLRRAGINFKGLCPFHNEKTPSFIVNPERKSFHCFGCGEGGDALGFVMRYHNLAFLDAVRFLAERYNITLADTAASARDRQAAEAKKQLAEINRLAAEAYHENLLASRDAGPAREYLKTRRIPDEVVREFQLGYAPDRWEYIIERLAGQKPERLVEAGLVVPNKRGGFYDRFRNRIMFPIRNHSGSHVGFGGRTLGTDPAKYINTPETPIFSKGQTLFGLYQNKDSIRKGRRCLIVEGNFDLLALVVHGQRNVVAPLGTAITPQHVRALKGYLDEAILLFDGDAAGIAAAMRAVPIFLSEQVAARVVVLPDGHDPDTFLAQEGAGAFAHLLDGAQALSEFVFSQLVQKYGQHLEGKAKIAAELRPLIEATADHSSQRKLFIAHFAEKLGLQPEDLTTAGGPAAGLLPRAGKRREGPIRTSDEGGVEATAAVLPKREEQILTFLLLHPEQVASFSEAGLGEILTSPSARTLHETLVRMASDGEATIDIDLVLPRLTPPEQRLVSRLLVLAAPESGEASEREADAQEKIAWIRRQRRLKRLHELTREIHAAQLGNNQRAILDLLAEKRALSVQDEGG